MKLFLASMLIASAVSHESLRGRSLQDPSDCIVNGAALLEIPGETLDADFVYDCVNRMGETARLILDDEQKNDLDAQVERGAVTLGEDQIDLTGAIKSGNTITLPNGKVKVIKSTSEGRKLGTLDKVGSKPILVVKVIDTNGKQRPESAAQISSDVFSDAVNLKSQLSDCSYGELTVTNDYSEALGFTLTQLEKISENIVAPGVMSATIDLDITLNDRYAIHNAVTSKVQSLLGFTLPGPFDQVMYVVEQCYVSCGYAAYAYINSWMSVYQGVYYKHVGVQVHELGHNFGLAHSGGLNGATYTDHTCLMGNPLYSDDVGKMCYNPAKNWQLPWYGGAGAGVFKKVYDPFVDSQFSFKLIGIGEYDNNPSNLPVVVKVESRTTANDLFIGYNRAIGPNAQNDEADNEVTIITTGNNGQSYSQSFLRAHLIQGESHTEVNFAGSGRDLIITADSINMVSALGAPGTASVSVVFVVPPTPFPTNPPTPNPTTPPPTPSPTPPPPTPNPTTPFPTNPPTPNPTNPPTLNPTNSPTATCTLAQVDELCREGVDCCSGVCSGGNPAGRVCLSNTPTTSAPTPSATPPSPTPPTACVGGIAGASCIAKEDCCSNFCKGNGTCK